MCVFLNLHKDFHFIVVTLKCLTCITDLMEIRQHVLNRKGPTSVLANFSSTSHVCVASCMGSVLFLIPKLVTIMTQNSISRLVLIQITHHFFCPPPLLLGLVSFLHKYRLRKSFSTESLKISLFHFTLWFSHFYFGKL